MLSCGQGCSGGDELPVTRGVQAAAGQTPVRGVAEGLLHWLEAVIHLHPAALHLHFLASEATPRYQLKSHFLYKATPACCGPRSRTPGHRGDHLGECVWGPSTPLGVLLCEGSVPESLSLRQRPRPKTGSFPRGQAPHMHNGAPRLQSRRGLYV